MPSHRTRCTTRPRICGCLPSPSTTCPARRPPPSRGASGEPGRARATAGSGCDPAGSARAPPAASGGLRAAATAGDGAAGVVDGAGPQLPVEPLGDVRLQLGDGPHPGFPVVAGRAGPPARTSPRKQSANAGAGSRDQQAAGCGQFHASAMYVMAAIDQLWVEIGQRRPPRSSKVTWQS